MSSLVYRYDWTLLLRKRRWNDRHRQSGALWSYDNQLFCLLLKKTTWIICEFNITVTYATQIGTHRLEVMSTLSTVAGTVSGGLIDPLYNSLLISTYEILSMSESTILQFNYSDSFVLSTTLIHKYSAMQ